MFNNVFPLEFSLGCCEITHESLSLRDLGFPNLKEDAERNVGAGFLTVRTRWQDLVFFLSLTGQDTFSAFNNLIVVLPLKVMDLWKLIF